MLITVVILVLLSALVATARIPRAAVTSPTERARMDSEGPIG